MKKEHYVVDENSLSVKKVLLDLDSKEYFYAGADRVKCYNELTNDARERTGKSYETYNIFNNEHDANMRLRMLLCSKALDCQKGIEKLLKKQKTLIEKAMELYE